MPRDDARLLVADPLLAQRPPQQRNPIQAALERNALRDGALGHPQPLLAIVAEAGEPERLPGAARLEEHRHVPEHLVPVSAPLYQSLQLRVDAPGIDLPAELLRLERVDRREVGPLAVFLLQPFLEGFEVVLGSEQHVVRVLVGRRCVRAELFLCPGVHPLHLRCRGTDGDSGEPQPLVDDRPLLGQDLRAEVDPLLVVGIGRRLHFGLERSDRLPLRNEDPPGLVVAHRHWRDDFRFARGQLPPPHRLSHERPVLEPAGQPRHLHRSARIDPQLLPGVVADVGVAQVHRPASDGQRVQALADGDVETAVTAADVPQQRINRVRHPAPERGIPYPREPRAEQGRGIRHRLQPRIELGACLAHLMTVATPSDIPSPQGRGTLWRTRKKYERRAKTTSAIDGETCAPAALPTWKRRKRRWPSAPRSRRGTRGRCPVPACDRARRRSRATPGRGRWTRSTPSSALPPGEKPGASPTGPAWPAPPACGPPPCGTTGTPGGP